MIECKRVKEIFDHLTGVLFGLYQRWKSYREVVASKSGEDIRCEEHFLNINGNINEYKKIAFEYLSIWRFDKIKKYEVNVKDW